MITQTEKESLFKLLQNNHSASLDNFTIKGNTSASEIEIFNNMECIATFPLDEEGLDKTIELIQVYKEL